jgi:hypothetical protein
MTRFKILSTAVMLPLMFVTPVFAQAAIQEPGAFAFYYPNYDVLNGGRPTPAARMDSMAGFRTIQRQLRLWRAGRHCEQCFLCPAVPFP